jgi:hypothetical protein
LELAIGSRNIATIGIIIMEVAISIYLTLRLNSSLYIAMIASTTADFWTLMFFPANNSAVMRSAHQRSYGSISGLLRTLGDIGIRGSFMVAISVASVSVPRSVAFGVFIGTINLP